RHKQRDENGDSGDYPFGDGGHAKVFALRERGWRCDACRSAERRSCERQFKQQEMKADAMKNYLLRDPKAVQPQSPARRRVKSLDNVLVRILASSLRPHGFGEA